MVGNNKLRLYLAWSIFFAALLVHVFWAKLWSSRYLIYLFNNCHAFLSSLSYAYHDIVNGGHSFIDFSVFSLPIMEPVGHYWPSLATMIGVWTLLFLPFEWFFLQNIFYLALTMLGIYFSTRFFIDDDIYSMVAAVIFSCYWAVMVQLVSFEVQLAATAFTVWGFYCYLCSKYFTKFWPSAFMGIFTIFALYCDRFTPAILLFSLFFIPENFKNKKSLLSMFLVAIFVIIYAWPFYEPLIRGTLRIGAIFFSLPNDVVPETLPPMEAYRIILCNPSFLIAHLTYYFISLPERLLGYGFTAFFAIGIVLFNRIKKPEIKIIWVAMIAPLLFFTLIMKKHYMYIFPLCIYFAMVTGMGICSIRKSLVRYALLVMIVGLSAVQLFSFFPPPPSHQLPSLFFSHYFPQMKRQGIPRLYFGDSAGMAEDIPKFAFSIIRQMELALRDLPEKDKVVLVDLQCFPLHHLTVLLLNLYFPRFKFINVPFLKAIRDDGKLQRDTDSLYLLSDKKEYLGENGRKSVDKGSYSWRSITALYNFTDSEIVFYKLS